MIEVSSKHPPGTVAFITANRPRYEAFYDSLLATLAPRGTEIQCARNYNAAHNRNELVLGMDEKSEWIWILDDDHAWEPDALMRLLDRQVDLVVPLYARRYYRFEPVIYKRFRPPFDIACFTWPELSEMQGLIEIEAAGAGGMLIRQSALKKITSTQVFKTSLGEVQTPPAYFRVGYSNGPEFMGTELDSINEDTGFFYRARKAGVKAYCDLDVSFGHCTDCVVVPMRQPDGKFNVSGDLSQPGTKYSLWLMPVT